MKNQQQNFVRSSSGAMIAIPTPKTNSKSSQTGQKRKPKGSREGRVRTTSGSYRKARDP